MAASTTGAWAFAGNPPHPHPSLVLTFHNLMTFSLCLRLCGISLIAVILDAFQKGTLACFLSRYLIYALFVLVWQALVLQRCASKRSSALTQIFAKALVLEKKQRLLFESWTRCRTWKYGGLLASSFAALLAEFWAIREACRLFLWIALLCHYFAYILNIGHNQTSLPSQ